MHEEYMCMVLKVPNGLEDDLEAFMTGFSILGSEVVDLKTLQEFHERKSEWELVVDEELVDVLEEASGGEISQDYGVVKIYFPHSPKGNREYERFSRRLYECFADQIVLLSEDVIPGEDWNRNWKKFFRPLEIGKRIVVLPPWESADDSRQAIIIDPGMAFGTGSHETTALCLEGMEDMDLSGLSGLDVGCGSGILAIYMKQKGATRVLAVDIDEDAIRAAKTNVKLNHVDVEVRKSDLLENVDATFDLVCANLLLAPVIRLIQEEPPLKQGGLLFLTGLLTEQEKEVRDLLEKYGYEEITSRGLNEWLWLRARKGKKE